jgi:hypothetical protein
MIFAVLTCYACGISSPTLSSFSQELVITPPTNAEKELQQGKSPVQAASPVGVSELVA